MDIKISKRKKIITIITVVAIMAITCSVAFGYTFSTDGQIGLTSEGRTSLTVNGTEKTLSTEPTKVVARNGKITINSVTVAIMQSGANFNNSYPLYIQTSKEDNQTWKNSGTFTITGLNNWNWNQSPNKEVTFNSEKVIDVGNAKDLYVRTWLGAEGNRNSEQAAYWHFELTHVKDDSKPANSPKTDDYASPIIYTAMAILSLVMIAFVLNIRRKAY